MPAPEAVLACAAPLIRSAEGFRAHPYRDTGGRVTIGWGSTHYLDGRAVSLSDPPISQAEAEALLEAAMTKMWNLLALHLERAPTDGQAAALLSLAYNIGVAALAGSSLLAKFNHGDIAGAANEFLRFDRSRIGGVLRVIPGLAARRQRERALFLAPDPPSPGKENS